LTGNEVHDIMSKVKSSRPPLSNIMSFISINEKINEDSGLLRKKFDRLGCLALMSVIKGINTMDDVMKPFIRYRDEQLKGKQHDQTAQHRKGRWNKKERY